MRSQLPHRSLPHPLPSAGLTFSVLAFSAAELTLPARDCLVLSILALRGNGIFFLSLYKQAGSRAGLDVGSCLPPGTPSRTRGRIVGHLSLLGGVVQQGQTPTPSPSRQMVSRGNPREGAGLARGAGKGWYAHPRGGGGHGAPRPPPRAPCWDQKEKGSSQLPASQRRA